MGVAGVRQGIAGAEHALVVTDVGFLECGFHRVASTARAPPRSPRPHRREFVRSLFPFRREWPANSAAERSPLQQVSEADSASVPVKQHASTSAVKRLANTDYRSSASKAPSSDSAAARFPSRLCL
jgi:hypothetical protein